MIYIERGGTAITIKEFLQSIYMQGVSTNANLNFPAKTKHRTEKKVNPILITEMVKIGA